jgi:hypothetical protein
MFVPNRRYFLIVDGVRKFMSNFINCSICWFSRNVNIAARELGQ